MDRAREGHPRAVWSPAACGLPARARARFAHGSAVLVVARVGWLGPRRPELVSSSRDLGGGIPRATRAVARTGSRRGRDGLCALRALVRPLLHGVLVPLERAADRVRAEHRRR